jgi:hypothetical protein
MLTEPKHGTMSATMCPVISRSTPAVVKKQGGRILTRYGVPLPSLIR